MNTQCPNCNLKQDILWTKLKQVVGAGELKQKQKLEDA